VVSDRQRLVVAQHAEPFLPELLRKIVARAGRSFDLPRLARTERRSELDPEQPFVNEVTPEVRPVVPDEHR
jgi:hypothetical protein